MELYKTIYKDQVYFNLYNHCPKKKKSQVIKLFTGEMQKAKQLRNLRHISYKILGSGSKNSCCSF